MLQRNSYTIDDVIFMGRDGFNVQPSGLSSV